MRPPYPWVEVRIVEPSTGRDVPVGEVGELWTRSRQNMAGYWQNPQATAEAVTPDGWFKTGDAGYTDADGYLYLHDRVKDMIVSGGENVYPAEVENVVARHPGVADVAVIGVPDERWGEAVKAIVVPAPGTEAGRPPRPTSSPSPATSWPATSCRSRSTSPRSCPATPPASCSSASCASPTGRAWTARSADPPRSGVSHRGMAT